MNIFILLTTAMLMPTVPTLKDHFTARVLMAILVMGLTVLVSRQQRTKNGLVSNGHKLPS